MKRHRKLRGRKLKSQRRIIIASIIGITFLFSAGYAAFSTSISMNAKGNFKTQTASTKLKKSVVTSGDGLYADPVEANRYVYKGANPHNYICLDTKSSGACAEGDLYRIIAIESDNTLKVIKNSSIDNIPWEPGYSTNISGITEANSTLGTRYSSNSSDFCYYSSESNYYGCKSWGSKTSTYDSTGNTNATTMSWEVNGTTKNLPQYDSYINVYLNGGTYPTTNGTTNITGWYYDQNNVIKNNISTNHLFNVGLLLDSSGQTLNEDITQEKAYTWKGNVGLINATDYVRANSDITNCGAVYKYNVYVGDYQICGNSNWLFNSENQWTISPTSSTTNQLVWAIHSTVYLDFNRPFNNYGVRPTFFLKSNIILLGEGTNDGNVYRIAS